MKLEKIKLIDVAGVAPLPELAFGPGINVVLGANGAGKSTLADLISQSIWRRGARVRGDASLQWQSSQPDAEPITYRLGPSQPDPVEIPGGRTSDTPKACYHLKVGDLIRAGEADKELAQLIQREITGGLDLISLQNRLKPKVQPGRNQAKKLRDAKDRLHATEQAQDKLAQSETTLSGLRERKKEAADAGRRVLLLENRAAELKHLAELDEAQRELAGFAPETALLTGRELADLKEERERLATKLRQRRATSEQIEKLERDVEDLGFGADVLPLPLANKLKRSAEDLSKQYDLLQRERHELNAEKSAQAVLSTLNSEEAAHLVLPDRAALMEFTKLQEEVARLQLAIECAENELHAIVDQETKGSPPDLVAAREVLSRWLLVPEPSLTEFPRKVMLVGIAIFGLSLLLLFLDTTLTFIGCAIGAGLTLGGWAGTRESANWQASRNALSHEFEATGIDSPREWARAHVASHQRALEVALAEALEKEKNNAKRAVIQSKLSLLRAEESAALQSANSLADRLSLRFDDSSPLQFASHLDRLRELSDATTRIATRQGRVDALEQSLEESAREYGATLDELGITPGTTLKVLQEQLETASDEIHEHGQLLEKLTERRHFERALSDECNDTEDRITAIFSHLNLDTDDDVGLHLLLEGKARFDEVTRLEQKASNLAEARAEVTARHEDILVLDEIGLQEELTESRGLASQLSEIDSEIATIEEQVRAAGSSSELAERLDAVQQAESELAAARLDHLNKSVQHRLIEMLADKHSRETQPEVLSRAKELFSLFTNKAWELELKHGEDFRAQDCNAQQSRALSELSTGTRMQLLIAARLAFVEVQESGEKLPLFLDEVLSSSDMIRSNAVATALAHVAAQGRQIFYFTVDPGDVDVLEEAAIRVQADFALTNLDEERGLETARMWKQVKKPQPRPQVPDIVGHNARTYAEILRAPIPGPFTPSSQLHLIHVLQDNLALLRHLLEENIETLGVWRRVADSRNAEVFVPEPGDVALISSRDRMHQSFVRQWQVGRGKLASGEVLEDWGFAKLKAGPELMATLADHDGDMNALVRAIDEKSIKLNKTKRNELIQNAVRDGYIDDNDPLDRADMLIRMRTELADDIDAGLLSRYEIESHIDSMLAMLTLSTDRNDSETEATS